MIRNLVIITVVTLSFTLFSAASAFAQHRATPGTMGGGLLGVPYGATASTDLRYVSNGAYYGRVTAFNGSHYQIDTNGTQIKTFRNSCRPASSNGVAGYVCSFGQFDRNGRHIYSGWGYFFQNGMVYLMWTNESIAGNHWRQISTPWFAFRPA